MEHISRDRRVGIKGPWREKHNVISGSEDVRDEWLIDEGSFGTALPDKGITLSAVGQTSKLLSLNSHF